MADKLEQPLKAVDVACSYRPQQQPSLYAHVQIMRLDHWIKNVFVLPGIAVAMLVNAGRVNLNLWYAVLLGLLATGLVASSNYVLNEVLDAPFDRLHPVKCRRPVPSGQVSIPWAYAQWIALMVAGVALGLLVNLSFSLTLLALWFMGCVYNVPPVRSKDVPYVDVLSEAVNNPIRMVTGWYIVDPGRIIPVSLLICYWMVGAYFMAIKRFSEFRHIGDPAQAASYRKSFGFYTDQRLLISILFYATTAMMFFGAFAIRYRVELVLAFPLISWVLAIYMDMGFRKDSAAESPEKLYRERRLMIAVGITTVIIAVLFLVDISIMHHWFAPTLPTSFP